MRVAQFVVAVVLTSTVSLPAQPVLKSISVTLKVVDATVAEVFDTIERVARIEIQVDEPAIAEAISRKVTHVNFVNSQLEDILRFVTEQSGLTYEVIDEQTIRIRAKQ